MKTCRNDYPPRLYPPYRWPRIYKSFADVFTSHKTVYSTTFVWCANKVSMRHYCKRKYSRLEIFSTGNARSIQTIFHKPTVSLFLRAAREPRWPNDEDARCSCNGPETSTDGCHGRRNAKKKKTLNERVETISVY